MSKRFKLASDLVEGTKGILTLTKEEYQLLGIWGTEESWKVVSGTMMQLHEFLAGVILEELRKRRDSMTENHSPAGDLQNLLVTPNGMKIRIETNLPQVGREIREFDLEMGAIREKFNSDDPSENWLFICGRPRRQT